MQSTDETEQQPKSVFDKLRTREQETKFPECIGKTYGYTCKNCLYRSYCDGIPEVFLDD